MEESEPTNPPNSTPPIFAYATPALEEMVVIARYPNEQAAAMAVNALEEAGIRVKVLGANTASLGIYQTFANVELNVWPGDVKNARRILSGVEEEFLEPDDAPETESTPAEIPIGTVEAGEQAAAKPAQVLVPLNAFTLLRELRDAQVVLASARVPSYSPKLIHRGDRPPGVGKRFILRVAEADLARARSILKEKQTEDRDDPRCPKCASWNVLPATHFWKELLGGLGLLPNRPKQLECRTCHFQAEAEEFKSGKP